MWWCGSITFGVCAWRSVWRCVQSGLQSGTQNWDMPTKFMGNKYKISWNVFNVYHFTACIQTDRRNAFFGCSAGLRTSPNDVTMTSIIFFLPFKSYILSNLWGSITRHYYYWYSALEPVWAETRVQSGDWYGSGTLHHGHVLRDSLPLLSPAF